MAGTGSCSASSGSQIRAASRVPSASGIHVWSMRRIGAGEVAADGHDAGQDTVGR